MNGLLGLAKNINSSESAVRDLGVLERMDARIQQDKNAEVAAQKEEALMYERMYQMSDQLLEKDRKRINKRIAMAQDQITEQVGVYGGSRKHFMEQGGMSIINNISNDIMRSDEVVQYQENKNNLAKILEAKEKGLGHLISPSDLRSLEEYENNPNGGKITYGGIMSEVEIPPSANFDYGTAIPMEAILSHGSNMMKIRGNYKIAYPDKPEPSPLDLYNFAREMGYGGTGSNTVRLRERAAERARLAKQQASRKSKDIPNSYLNQLNVLKSQVDKGLNVNMINGKYEGDLIGSLSKTNPSFNKLLGAKSAIMSRDRKLSREGLDSTDFMDSSDSGILDSPNKWMVGLFNEKMGLKESYQIMPHNTADIAQRLFTEKVENGMVINMVPSTQDFNMNGVQMSGSEKLDADDHKGNYKLLGAHTALKTVVTNGEDGQRHTRLMVNAYNDDGTIDEKASANIDEAYGNSEAQLTTVMAFENENGDVFYREIDISDPQIKTVFSNALAEDDNITDTVNQENQSAAIMNQIEAMSAEEEIQFNTTMKAMDEKVFNSPVFESEGQQYWGSQSAGQENRYPMMKSFYMAFDYINNSYKRNEQFPQGDKNIYADNLNKMVDKNWFTTVAIEGGIEDDLKSYEQGNSEETIIAKWLKNINESTDTALGKRRNEELAQKWLQMLSLSR